jgi:hypothetical protein
MKCGFEESGCPISKDETALVRLNNRRISSPTSIAPKFGAAETLRQISLR